MKTLTAAQIESIIADTGAMPQIWWPMDDLYLEPSLAFVQGDFASAFRANTLAAGVDTYQGNRNDCDKFAFHACNDMKLMHARTAESRQYNAGIAFGLWQYHMDIGEDHMINVAVIEYELVFFEPQRFQIVQLSYQEVCSCYGVLI